jgi:hypothetical protein
MNEEYARPRIHIEPPINAIERYQITDKITNPIKSMIVKRSWQTSTYPTNKYDQKITVQNIEHKKQKHMKIKHIERIRYLSIKSGFFLNMIPHPQVLNNCYN